MLVGMSDLCLYELEDTVWDEFCQSDDHIVPHPGYEQADVHPILSDSRKKPRSEVNSISTSIPDRYDARYVDQGRQHGGFSSLSKRRNKMLEKDSRSDAPSGVFPPSSDSNSIKEASSLASENTTSSSHAFKSNNTESNSNQCCAKDTIPGDKTTTVDNNSFSCPLGDITDTENNLDFFENSEDKDSSDFLCYGWPEIGNFEDVDRMFRSCDSTFGLGANKEDELGWFPSADNIGGPGDIVKSDFKFSCPELNPVENITQNPDFLKDCSINDSAMTSAPIRYEDSSWPSETSDSYMSFANGPAMANSKDGSIPKEQINKHKKQVKLQDHSIGKREDDYVSNSSISYMSNLPNEVVQLPFGANSGQACPSVHTRQHHHEHALGPDSCNYLQNHLSYLDSDNSPLCDLTSVNLTLPAAKSESNDFTSPSPRDSCHASNQLQSSSHDPPFPATAAAGSGKREKPHNHQGGRSSVNSSPKNGSSMVRAAMGNPRSIGKQVYYSEDKSENHSDMDGISNVIPAELGSSNMQESSTVGSGIDDNSLEAASFRQLQLVMEQLDLRTKICIRDSLYRLAQSAEQRHNHPNSNGCCGDERDVSRAFAAEGANDFVGMETDTNPIDRSIAHLLFHRPSESSDIPAHDLSPLKTHSMVHASITSPLLRVENSAICEETAEIEKLSDR